MKPSPGKRPAKRQPPPPILIHSPAGTFAGMQSGPGPPPMMPYGQHLGPGGHLIHKPPNVWLRRGTPELFNSQPADYQMPMRPGVSVDYPDAVTRWWKENFPRIVMGPNGKSSPLQPGPNGDWGERNLFRPWRQGAGAALHRDAHLAQQLFHALRR